MMKMTGEARRAQILQLLRDQDSPLSGTLLANEFHVSRQVIVQDIALMRAERHDILSTNRGYLYRREDRDSSMPKRVFFVRHSNEQVLEEFLTVTELGGNVLDVVVEHELYGQIRVDLMIENDRDAREFYEKLIHSKDNPLKVLTDDCHYHTVAAPSEKLLDLIEQELDHKGYLLR
ncbi:MAG: transcription repressor NadR [Faecousia sp.]